MVNVIIQEYQNSIPEHRTVPVKHAHNLGLNGGFYKVQILGDFDQVVTEYKA
ncbi:hypothetical protein KUA24_15 [Vibrio phage HNL01]|nr:hypothetical protein KUA24_15 [Vibrio phage HNL01]